MKSKSALLAILLNVNSLMGYTAQWIGTTDVWPLNTNWSPSTSFPNGSTDIANLTAASTPNATITLSNTTIQLQTLNLDYSATYTINSGGANGYFLFSPTSAGINVTTSNGNSTNTINTEVHLGGPLSISQGSNLPLTFGAQIVGTSTIGIFGPGTTVFGVDNTATYTGAITINSGTLSIADDKNLGDLTTALTIVSGTLLASDTTSSTRDISLSGIAGLSAASTKTYTANGTISGTGSLNISGTGGTIVLTGTNTYQGGTTISSGTLSIASDTNLGDTAGAFNIGNGTLLITMPITTARSGTFTGTTGTIQSSLTNTFSGDFIGSGGIILTGGGTFNFTGSNNYDGGTTINANTTLSGNTDGIQGAITLAAATSVLTFDQTTDGTYAGVITGPAMSQLNKQGTGNVTISGASPAFFGTTDITAGTLTVTGSLAGPVTVGTGGTLSGTGTVGATTSSGTIDPGSGTTIGTLNINGALLLNNTSAVNITIAPLSTDLIAVTGGATLNGSLTVDPLPGFYGFSADYTILTSTGIGGPGFAPVTSTNGAFAPVITTTATDVLLHLVIAAPFAAFPFSNFNTAAVGHNVDALYAANELSADMFAVFNTFIGIGNSLINEALDQMHPAPYSAFTELQSEIGGQLLSVFHRLPYLPCCCSNPSRLWIEPYGNSLTMKRHGLEIGFQANTGGIAFGYDGQINQNLILGIGGAWASSRLEWHDHRGHGDLNGLYGGFYFDSQFDDFYFGGSFLAGKDFYTTSRHLFFTTIDRHAEAEYQALDIMGQLSTAYLFGSPQAFFYPYANIDYLYHKTDSFNENGAQALDLDVQGWSDGTLRTEMGLGLQVQDTNQAQTMCVSPLVSLGWVNMAPIQRPLIKSNFTGTTIPFEVRGWDETWNLFNINFGLRISYLCFSANLKYNAEFSPDSHTLLFNQNGGISLDWKW